MSTPERKRKRKRTTTTKKKQLLSTPQSTLGPSLPDELVLIIVARVPRLYYPTLSLVSKSFRSLIASPELYKFRSLLGRTESCLYICVNMYCYEGGNTWYTLCRNPDKALTNGTSSGFAFVRLPIPNPPHTEFSNLAVVGSDIYNIGLTRSNLKASSSSVLILDCTSHTWREGPNLPVELFTATVSAAGLDGKIYVSGEDADSDKASYHVFDPKAQVWYPEKDVVAHHSKQGRCMEHHLAGLCGYHIMMLDSYCEIDNVLYAFKNQALTWYDTEKRGWRNVLGLEGLPTMYNEDRVRLADYGGKMAFLWDCIYTYERSVCCAEIALERRTTCEIWGNIEWLDHVLKIPDMAYVQKAFAATL